MNRRCVVLYQSEEAASLCRAEHCRCYNDV